MIKVKICGIKRKEDALAAASYGADAIGLLVGQRHTSNDFIGEETAKEITRSLPPFCSSVLVTHITSISEIVGLTQRIGVTTIQLHGDSTPEDAQEIKRQLPHIKLYKVIHVNDESSIEFGKQFLGVVDAILLDTANKATGQVGGTGLVHDWNISRRIIEMYSKPVILAGGLGPDNVREAIEVVNPFGVDVNSGTKNADGFKDYSKLKQFIEAAKLTR